MLYLLSAIVFLPVLGAVILAFFPKGWDEGVRWFTLAVTVSVLVLTAMAFMTPSFAGQLVWTGEDAGYMQNVFSVPWIGSFDIYYFMGIDGISFPLLILTAVVCVLAMGASWSIKKHVKAYCILFLLLETGMLGVFMALDFFLFYVFWEVMLLPMYFLIGVWGGPRREYASIKFFLFTLFGSVLMLIAILLLYFNSDVRELVKLSERNGGDVNLARLHLDGEAIENLGLEEVGDEGHLLTFMRVGDGGSIEPMSVKVTGGGETAAALADGVLTITYADGATMGEVAAAVTQDEAISSEVFVGASQADDVLSGDHEFELAATSGKVHSFNILALAAMGQNELIDADLQWWCFILLFIGFAIKVPSVPFHTWLPDAHVEAPTPISMILAGVLLKMGGYGILRICYPICPHGGFDLAYVVCLIGVVSMVYGAFAALAQKDFKRLVAYSSVSHMGYVVLGLGVWSANSETMFNSDAWNQGIQGAMFQMIAHGISSAGMFFIVGVIYDRVHHRNLDQFGGLFAKMPIYTAFAFGIFFAGLGLPGLCGFIGEVFVVFAVSKFSMTLCVISASVVVLTAAYILWTLQRVFLGAEYRGPHEEEITPTNLRENLIAGTLFVMAIIFGVFPRYIGDTPSILGVMEPTIERQVEDLTHWTRTIKVVQLAEEKAAAEKAAKEKAAEESSAAEPMVGEDGDGGEDGGEDGDVDGDGAPVDGSPDVDGDEASGGEASVDKPGSIEDQDAKLNSDNAGARHGPADNGGFVLTAIRNTTKEQ
jgi:NADH:ubiquinone oxidoreductase subunit 4 (subunit M)